MIQYKVTGSIVRYTNPDKSDIHSFEEIFQSENPIIARQKAIKFYNDYLLSIQEAGEKIEDKITKGGDDFDDIGLGIGVYLEITDPFEKLWDNVNLPDLPLPGIGTGLEETIKHLIDEGQIEDEDEFELYESDFQWVLLGKGDGIFATPPWFIKGLENEIAIFDYFDYDKNDLETTASCYDHNDNKIKEHRILELPYNWNDYNEQQLTDRKTQPERTTQEIEKYLEWIKVGEGDTIEFKSTLCYSENTNKKEIYIKLQVVKTIAAFLNTFGGTLFIGVNDKKEIIGLDNDYKFLTSEDKQNSFKRMFDNIINTHLNNQHFYNIRGAIHTYNGLDFMRITVSPSKVPVYLPESASKKVENVNNPV